MDESRRRTPDMDPLALVGDTVLDAFDLIDLPAYVIDRNGTLRWANRAGLELFGDRVGQPYTSLVSYDSRKRVEAQFVREVVCGEATSYTATVIDTRGERCEMRVLSVPLRRLDRTIVGVFGVAFARHTSPGEQIARTVDAVQLTPRQTEVLGLLAEGLTTEAIANRLGVAVETARNHIRAVLRSLGAHSRLEAVVEGRERGLLDP